MFDFIGDIHGQYQKLVLLLSALGYKEIEEFVWKHPEGRKLIFLGDLVDRGPEQRKVVNLVRKTCEAGLAECLMGNHEYNSVCWEIAYDDQPNQYLYQRNSRNKEMHEPFVAEYNGDKEAYLSDLNWFKSLPIAIEKPGFRAVHACWHTSSLVAASLYFNDDMSIPDFAWKLTKNKDHPLYSVIENVLKGPEVRIPKEIRKADEDGHVRDMIRLAWWPTESEGAKDVLVTSDSHKKELPDTQLMATFNRFVYRGHKPVFFGHYWFTGTPGIISEKMACLDYCAGKGGPMVAYRWDGEEILSEEKIVYV